MSLNKEITNYISTLNKLFVDTEIKEKIVEKINFYKKYGKIYFKENNLYGTFINTYDLTRATPAKEFLEIKILDNNVICNYSEQSNKKIINIVQNGIKGGNTSICKKESTDIRSYNNNNRFSIEEIEKIYNYQDDLIYESNLEKEYNYDTYPYEICNIIYRDNNYGNYFSLEKKWYIQNGSIIKYNLSKSFVNENDTIYETYSICPELRNVENDRDSKFVSLDKEIFKKFMLGNITINELIEENNQQKKLIKK